MNICKFFLRSTALVAAVATIACSSKQTSEAFPVPEKPILEMDYSADKTTFEVWAPTAESAVVRLYDGDTMVEELKMFRNIPLFELLQWATINGAKALGVADKFGSIEEGKQSGIINLTGVNLDDFTLTAESKAVRIL